MGPCSVPFGLLWCEGLHPGPAPAEGGGGSHKGGNGLGKQSCALSADILEGGGLFEFYTPTQCENFWGSGGGGGGRWVGRSAAGVPRQGFSGYPNIHTSK